MAVVYVLELAHGRWYVGASLERNFARRTSAHFSGTGAVWTRVYRPLRVVEVVKGGDYIVENAVTKRYMQRYGIDRVRGGAYCTLRFDARTLAFLDAELAASAALAAPTTSAALAAPNLPAPA